MNPETLIILKNSIIEGRVPISDSIEVGELALGLFKGSESIWAKNSSGDVIDLRSPRHDLIWGDLLELYEDKDQFEKKLSSGDIKDTCIVFIKKENLIWSQGSYYSSKYSEEELINILLNRVFLLSPKIENLNEDTESEQIDEILGIYWDRLIDFCTSKVNSFYLVYVENNQSFGKTLADINYIDNNLSISWENNNKKYYLLINKSENIYKILKKTIINLNPYLGEETDTAITIIKNDLNTISVNIKEDAINSLIPSDYVDQIFDEIFL